MAQQVQPSSRQELGQLSCGMEKKTNDVACSIRTEIDTLTERHAQKQISLLEFIHGLSMLIAVNSATVL